MKFSCILVILFIFTSCSFDNKTGIWKDYNSIETTKDSLFKDFKKISTSAETFNSIIRLNKNFDFKLSNIVSNSKWNDLFYSNSNNFENFKYNDNNQLLFQSKKLTKHNPNKYLLYENKNIIFNDQKGNLITYSIEKKEIISKFNFYKKRYKNLKKNLNLIVNQNIIYVSDNLGYLYAYNFETRKLLWAKNYKIPFKSNLKIFNNVIIAANLKNNIFFFNIVNGEILKSIPTEETVVSNQFVNNFSIKNNTLFFLNSFGSLYSLNINLRKINWFINLNQSLELTTSDLFNGSQIVNHKNRIVVSANKRFYLIDSLTGSIISFKNFQINLKPIINKEYIFLLTDNNFLTALNLETGDILYAYNIKNDISKFLKTKKKLNFSDFFLANNKIIVFFNNSYIATFNINGKIQKINKLTSKIKTKPIFINGSIFYLDKNNKLKIVD